MIEEAAGTRMYESKRTSAQRTIEKKDSKLREIETVSRGASCGWDNCGGRSQDRLPILRKLCSV